MHRLIPFLFFFSCLVSFGQNSLLSTAFTWFGKGDRTSIDSYLKGNSYQFIGEKDSTPFHVVNYSLVKTENGTQPFVTALLSDTALEFISLDTYGHRTDISVLKSARFKSIGTDINGNFITTTYDNGTFLIHEDYEAVGNPLGKGEIAYFRYRILRKYGPFDQLNGEKIRVTENGEKVSENYKNGLLDGQRTIYFSNGTIKRTENYRAGRLNGVASDYDPEGKIIHSSTHSYHWKYGVEKWYNRDGKLVKSLQWQRDIPVGTEKLTFNGTTIGSIPYVKGMKHGLAKVPVYRDDYVPSRYPIDTFNYPPLGIETVTYKDGLRSGKAICMYFKEPDTLYVAYYKAGRLDSIYLKYEHNKILYTTSYTNGWENGTRIFRIPSGPLKDSIYRTEYYRDGIPNGPVFQYYQKQNQDTKDVSEPKKWNKIYLEEHYKDGLRHGPFIYRTDSLNYRIEHYVYEKQEGTQTYEGTIGGKHIRSVCHYENDKRSGEWTTENLTDSIIVTENFLNNQRHGSFIKKIKGFKTEERFYERDTLKRLMYYEKNGDSRVYALDPIKNSDLLYFTLKIKNGDSISELSYFIEKNNFIGGDTLLLTLISRLKTNTPEMSQKLNGLFRIVTPAYETSGHYKNGNLTDNILVMHIDAAIFENTFYKEGVIQDSEYTKFKTHDLYSGTFISAVSGEQISVKEGLRHGWCVEYDASGKEIRRTKYKYGVLKKVVESNIPD